MKANKIIEMSQEKSRQKVKLAMDEIQRKILSKEENKGKIAFFGGIKNCRFKGQVTPGDVLEMECVLTKQKGPVGIGEAIAKVNGKVVCKAELTFAIQ